MSFAASAVKCPRCKSGVKKPEGPFAVCSECSRTQQRVYRFCWACQREWSRDNPVDSACIQPNCALRAALLSNKLIENPNCSVHGCPYFRACPKCKALLTHTGIGCPNIICPQCHTAFCFRCFYPYTFVMGTMLHGHRSHLCNKVDNLTYLTVLGL